MFILSHFLSRTIYLKKRQIEKNVNLNFEKKEVESSKVSIYKFDWTDLNSPNELPKDVDLIVASGE